MSASIESSIPPQDVPVLLTIFNRPDKTRAVIDNLRKIKPRRLFVYADGPRRDRPGEKDQCEATRRAATNVDWICDLKVKLSDDNKGCDPAVSEAIDWFFECVDFGVILEDDCLVHPDFFKFCGELFIRYLADQRIMQISSLSPYGTRVHPYDYHFSRVFRCSGGWGTWRRAWKHFISDMRCYDRDEVLIILQSFGLDRYDCSKKVKEISRYITKARKTKPTYYWQHWDYQWNLSCATQNGLCIVPEQNLMQNIGFDNNATNTKVINTVFSRLSVSPLVFPLRHPRFCYADHRPERGLEKRIFNDLNTKSRCMYLLRRLLGSVLYIRDALPFF